MKPTLSTTIIGLIKDNSSIANVDIHTTGEPILSTTAKESFMYSFAMQTWLQLTVEDRLFDQIPRALPKLDHIEVFWN